MKKWIAIVGLLTIAGAAGLALKFSIGKGRPDWDSFNGQAGGEIWKATSNDRSDEFVAWNQFRGPNGQGISIEKNIPASWSAEKNLAWKCKLPGAGASSPILTRSFVFVTCYSGYGVPGAERGTESDLIRHLCCIDRQSGNVVWQKQVANQQREDPYRGMGVPEHGYATNTPVTDGESVFVFFGKTGVISYDLMGKENWRTSVGKRSANRRWGSAASLILSGDHVIVNAAEEGRAIIALDKKDGQIAWKAPGNRLELCYSTPSIIKVNKKRADIVVALAGEIWGINPSNGKLVWSIRTSMTGNLSPSLNVSEKRSFCFWRVSAKWQYWHQSRRDGTT